MDTKERRKESHNKGILFWEQEESHARAAMSSQKHVETIPGQLALGTWTITVDVGSLSGPPATGFRTGRRGSVWIGFQKVTAVYSSSRVWLSLKENKSGATWIATRTDGCMPLSVRRSSCGKGEMREHGSITYKQEQRNTLAYFLPQIEDASEHTEVCGKSSLWDRN